MKHQASWQTAQRLSSRNRKYIWCHPEAKLRKVFVGNVFWKREFGTLCKKGHGTEWPATTNLHMAVAWEKYMRQFPGHHPSPETCDSGTSVTDFLVCVCVRTFNSMKLFSKLFFLNTDKPLQTDTPVAPNSTADTLCEEVSWLSLTTLPLMPSTFLHGNRKWIQICLLQIIRDFTDPTKALSLAFLSDWQFILSICSRYRCQFALWMLLSLSPGPFPSLLKPDDLNCKEHSCIYSGIFPFCFISFPRNWWTLHRTISLKVLFLSDIVEFRVDNCVFIYIHRYIKNSPRFLVFFASLNDWVLLPNTSLFTPFQVIYGNKEQALAYPTEIHWICPAIETNQSCFYHLTFSVQ